MVDKIKKISNPLTIIAIFAGLAEIAGTTALFGIDKEIQTIFIWFVMLFPTLIVTLFFLTLNFNASVLYAPSDFENDTTFLEAQNGKKSIESNFSNLEEEINKLSKTIEDGINSKPASLSPDHINEIKDTIKDELDSLRARVSLTKEATEKLSEQSIPTSVVPMPKSALQAEVLELITNSVAPLSALEISQQINKNRVIVFKALHRLTERNVIIKTDKGYISN